MLELAIPLKENFQKSALEDLTSWFSTLPNNAAWYVISDYCFGDKTKKNDTVTFSILLNHDKLANIQDYINRYAPKDIKSSRKVSPEFLQYINSPVIFNITFLVDRDTKLLKDYADKENMECFLPAFKDFVTQVDANSALYEGFVESVLGRTDSFQKDFGGKNFNAKLSRQIYLVATFASLVFYYLNKLKKPSHIICISDRDALVDRYDGFIYDLAYFMFFGECSGDIAKEDNSKRTILNRPNFRSRKKLGRTFMMSLFEYQIIWQELWLTSILIKMSSQKINTIPSFIILY